jgi:hypothetical protein
MANPTSHRNFTPQHSKKMVALRIYNTFIIGNNKSWPISPKTILALFSLTLPPIFSDSELKFDYSTLIINDSLQSIVHSPFSTLLRTPYDPVNLFLGQRRPLYFNSFFKLLLRPRIVLLNTLF